MSDWLQILLAVVLVVVIFSGRLRVWIGDDDEDETTLADLVRELREARGEVNELNERIGDLTEAIDETVAKLAPEKDEER